MPEMMRKEIVKVQAAGQVSVYQPACWSFYEIQIIKLLLLPQLLLKAVVFILQLAANSTDQEPTEQAVMASKNI